MGKIVKSNNSLSTLSELKDKVAKNIKDRFHEDVQEDMIQILNSINPGDMFYWRSDYRDIFIVDEIKYEKKYNTTYLYYRDWDWDNMAWGTKQEHQTLPECLRDIKFPKLTKHPLEYIKEAEQAIASGDVSKYFMDDDEAKEVSGLDTSLVAMNSKENLENIKYDLEVRRDKAQLVKRTMEVIIERKRQQALAITEKLATAVAQFKKKIEKIFRVITTLELYLGIEETIIQIQEGPTASETEPISIRQGLMYMDEEVGDPWDDGQGIEWRHVKDFDKWLTRNDNYKKVLPELKGIAAFQCRRNHKDAPEGQNPFVTMMMQQSDDFTFLLMRNGDNLYRIITDKIQFRPRLFPQRDELQKLYELYRVAELAESEGSNRIFHDEEKKLKKKFGKDFEFKIGATYEETKDMAEDHAFFYKMRFALLQGIIERTQVFQPTAEPVKLFDNSSIEKGLIRLIYDDELTLPSHKKEFWDWLKDLNSTITFGSRIVLSHTYKFKKEFGHGKYSRQIRSDRLDERYKSTLDNGAVNYNLPPMPNEGLFYIEKGFVEVTKPVWIPNPNFDPTKPVTPFHDRFDPDEKGEKRTYSMAMTYRDQKKYFGKIVKKATFPSDDPEDQYGYVDVPLNPEMIHKFEVTTEEVISVTDLLSKNPKSKKKTRFQKRFQYVTEKEPFMCIRYNPKDEISKVGWTWVEPFERKNRISWKIKTDDEFILNYDAIKKEDIEFYLTSRVDRRNYISMMPVLWEVLKVMQKEEKEEKDFKKLVKGQVYKATKRMPSDAEVNEAVENWKTGLKWKRAVAHDDEKALRMIVKELSKK